MWRYLRSHERFVIAALEAGPAGESMAALKAFHEKQIAFMQHERLVHLLVLLAVALCLLLSAGFAVLYPSIATGALAAILLGLFAFYVLHYYRLENGVQRLYALSNRIDAKLGLVPEGTLAGVD
jgi:fatty acid desaturase